MTIIADSCFRSGINLQERIFHTSYSI